MQTGRRSCGNQVCDWISAMYDVTGSGMSQGTILLRVCVNGRMAQLCDKMLSFVERGEGDVISRLSADASIRRER